MFPKILRTLCVRTLLYIIDLLIDWIAKLDKKKEATDDSQVGIIADEGRVLFKYGEFLNKNYEIRVGNCADELVSGTIKEFVKTDDNSKSTPSTQIQTTDGTPLSSICQIPVGKNMAVPPTDKQKLIDYLFEIAKEDDVENWARELRRIMGKKGDLPWLVHYMVVNRISHEPEHQKTYLKLIEYLNSDIFDKSMVSSTIENLRIMLRTKSKYDIFAMRNLSEWLTLITHAGRRGLLVDASDLEKIQLEVKNCTEELLSGVGRKFTRTNNISKITPSTRGRTTRHYYFRN